MSSLLSLQGISVAFSSSCPVSAPSHVPVLCRREQGSGAGAEVSPVPPLVVLYLGTDVTLHARQLLFYLYQDPAAQLCSPRHCLLYVLSCPQA